MRFLYIWFFAIVLAVPVSAYIDPGTGSMLFSLLTGVAVTAFFFLKNLFIKLKIGLFFKKQVIEKKEKLVIFCEGKQYWNVFKPIVEELAKRELECAYYSADEGDPGLGFESRFVHTRYIGSGNVAYRFLNFLQADLCLMTTPGLDVFQLKRSPGVRHYCHILHTVTDATTYRLFGLDYFDSVLLTGEYQKKDIRTLEKLRGLKEKQLEVVGCTYLDVFQARLANTNTKSPYGGGRGGLPHPTILVAPSWGANAILRRYGLSLLEPLARTDMHLIIRPHPQSLLVEKATVDECRGKLSGFENVEWDFNADNLGTLARADLLISDFSGVVFDYAFLFERPVLYASFDFDKRPYDLADIPEEPWTFRGIRTLGRPLSEDQFSDIGTVLTEALASNKSGIQALKAEGWMFQGEAAKRTVDFLSVVAQ